MQSRSTRMMPWFAVYGIVVFVLGVLAGELFFREVAFAAQIQAPSIHGATHVPSYPAYPPGGTLTPVSVGEARSWRAYRIVAGDTLGTIAQQFGTTPETLFRLNRKRRVPGQKPLANRHDITAGALLLIPPVLASPRPTEAPESPMLPPVLEEQASISTTKAPPLNSDETIIPTLADIKDGQTSLQAALGEQATRLAELIELVRQYDRQLTQLIGDIAKFQSDLERQTNAIAALRHDADKRFSRAKTVALAVGSVFTLVTLGAFLFLVSPGRPSPPAPTVQTAAHAMPPVATPKESAEHMDMQRTIATSYLSAPKGEDVIRSAGEAHFSALVLADGASTLRFGGEERSGGGAQAAQIAAQTAITSLTNHLLPAMRIEELLPLLEDCFRDARTALEHSNALARTPGATTLLMALLCQARDGRWYWLSGHVGNGVLALLHTEQLLSSWPIHTPLLSRHTNGITTITLPGYEEQGYRPSVSVRPHRPGDLFVIGSDGLDHLDAVTKHGDRLTFGNYLWKHIRDERSGLERALETLATGRQDGQWRNALSLDDTTIGILWA